jgi:hypothetical protein
MLTVTLRIPQLVYYGVGTAHHPGFSNFIANIYFDQFFDIILTSYDTLSLLKINYYG